MLYHVENFDTIFSNVKKLSNEHTKIAITTKSYNTFPVLESIYKRVVDRVENSSRDERHFSLENGKEILNRFFDPKEYMISEKVLKTEIVCDNQNDVINYAFSTQRYKPENQPMTHEEYLNKWQNELSKTPIFKDTNVTVLFTIERRI
jgi:hypothetical protein